MHTADQAQQGGRYKQSKPFYHTTAWKKVRQQALLRDGGMCQDCMDRIRAGYGFHPRRATMVHHVKSIEERPDLALDLDNLRSLCSECHNVEHPEKGRRRQDDEEPHHLMRVIRV